MELVYRSYYLFLPLPLCIETLYVWYFPEFWVEFEPKTFALLDVKPLYVFKRDWLLLAWGLYPPVGVCRVPLYAGKVILTTHE